MIHIQGVQYSTEKFDTNVFMVNRDGKCELTTSFGLIKVAYAMNLVATPSFPCLASARQVLPESTCFVMTAGELPDEIAVVL